MRDVGTMGESTFALWCSQAGLIANGSRIDRTGWDFYVEFPSHSILRPEQLHQSALECKVQIKSTDSRRRKLPVKLSNLRRLATAQMPAFFAVIEFDGMEMAQRAFLVHVDYELIERILRRIHECQEIEGKTNFNQHTLTINYGEKHELLPVNGQELRCRLKAVAPAGMSEYVAGKKVFLETIGFESGHAKFKFQTKGEENIRDLIDVSLGIRRVVQVTGFTGFPTRFGIASKKPMIEMSVGQLEMPGIKPTTSGEVRFREDRLSPPLCLQCKLYVSPLSRMLPPELLKIRVEGEGFEFHLSPFTGEGQYDFSLDPGLQLPLTTLQRTLRLLFLITSSSRKVCAEFCFEDFPTFEMGVDGQSRPFEFVQELHALELASEILNGFGVQRTSISLRDVSQAREDISRFHSVLNAERHAFKIEFGVNGAGFDSAKPVACISLTTSRIGKTLLGLILVVTGNVNRLPADKFELLARGVAIEKKLVFPDGGPLPKADLVAALEAVEEKYDADHQVVTLYDKG